MSETREELLRHIRSATNERREIRGGDFSGTDAQRKQRLQELKRTIAAAYAALGRIGPKEASHCADLGNRP